MQNSLANACLINGQIIQEVDSTELKAQLSKSDVHFDDFPEVVEDKLSDIEEKPKICEICLLVFEDEETLTTHKASHSADEGVESQTGVCSLNKTISAASVQWSASL